MQLRSALSKALDLDIKTDFKDLNIHINNVWNKGRAPIYHATFDKCQQIKEKLEIESADDPKLFQVKVGYLI